MEIGEEMLFPSFFRKMLMSAFLLRFKANYLEKMHGYPHFSLWIPIAFAKVYFFRMVPIWHKNLLNFFGICIVMIIIKIILLTNKNNSLIFTCKN